MSQSAEAKIFAPMEVEETTGGPSSAVLPAYEFEPNPEELLDALLPKYINTRIYAALPGSRRPANRHSGGGR